MYPKRLLSKLIGPTGKTEDSRRQQFILSALLLGILILSVASSIRATYDFLRFGNLYPGASPIIPWIITLVFLVLYMNSRSRSFHASAYALVSIIGLAGMYCLYAWGIILPTGLLMIVLGIIMSSILISARFSLLYAAIVSTGILALGYLETSGLNRPNTYWTQNLGGIGDAITFACVLGVITIVSWLSNREIDQSLARARRSEHALQIERDQLEARVIERTKQLEEAQREKIMQLYRFADFGRISSSLLHDIINPLTAVSLNLEQLSIKRRSDLVSQAIEGIKYIEDFVQSARKQIQNPEENRLFSPRREISDLTRALAGKLHKNQITIKLEIDPKLQLVGSPMKFHQLISNLLSNSIDAYEDFDTGERFILVSLQDLGKAYRLEVQDHGKGISPADIEKIFEPFFTTKTDDKGTGIGLFISRRIVEEDFAGTISATNSGAGTNITVDIPKRS